MLVMVWLSFRSKGLCGQQQPHAGEACECLICVMQLLQRSAAAGGAHSGGGLARLGSVGSSSRMQVRLVSA